jgi:hypothetical protein
MQHLCGRKHGGSSMHEGVSGPGVWKTEAVSSADSGAYGRRHNACLQLAGSALSLTQRVGTKTSQWHCVWRAAAGGLGCGTPVAATGVARSGTQWFSPELGDPASSTTVPNALRGRRARPDNSFCLNTDCMSAASAVRLSRGCGPAVGETTGLWARVSIFAATEEHSGRKYGLPTSICTL